MYAAQLGLPNNSTSKELQHANIYIGMLVLIIGMFGSTVNIYNVFVLHRTKTYNNSYGYLCFARSYCNILNLLLFVVYVAPDTLFQLLPNEDDVGRILGLVGRAGHSSIPTLQLGIAFNRGIAIFLPLRYKELCTKHWALIIIGCGLVYGAGLSCEQVAEDCRFVYDLSRFSWVYVNCSMIVHSYIFVYPLLIFIALTLSTNVIIAIKLVSEKLSNHKRTRKNSRLFWQSFIEDIFFANVLVWESYLYNIVDSVLWQFISCTLMWELTHTIDGFVLLVFHANAKKPPKMKLWRKSSALHVIKATAALEHKRRREHTVTVR